MSKPFGIFTCHPRSLVSLDGTIGDLEGSLVVEENDDLTDPLVDLEVEVYRHAHR